MEELLTILSNKTFTIIEESLVHTLSEWLWMVPNSCHSFEPIEYVAGIRVATFFATRNSLIFSLYFPLTFFPRCKTQFLITSNKIKLEVGWK